MSTPMTSSDQPWPPPSAPRGGLASNVMAGGASDDDVAPMSGPRGALGLAGVIGLFVVLALFNIWWFVFAFGLLVSIVLHELGHFVTARATGMKATQFFIGFGPRLWSMRRGETEYGLRALPLGAFVRIIGMNNLDEVDPADETRAYRAKSYPRRMLVITAGSAMHMVLALVLLSGVFAVRGETTAVGAAEIAAVGDAMPATGSILAGDVVTAVGGVPVTAEGGLAAAVTSHAPGDTVVIDLERDGASTSVVVELGSNALVGGDGSSAFLGVSSWPVVETVQHSVWSAPFHAVSSMIGQVGDSVTGVLRILNPSNIVGHLTGSNADPMTRPTTLVGITGVSDDVGRNAGLAGVLELLAYLNVFVGVFNLFPLLPLDGGHAAIATYERVREGRSRRRYHVDVARLMPLTMAVVALLAFLFLSGLYLDIVSPVG
jgi:membrane-associated protease RseP (regulator of RpoE activity)